MATGPLTEPRNTSPQDAEGIALAEELSEIAERAQSFTDAAGVLIALKRSGNQLVVRTSDGIAPEVGVRIPFPSGVTGLCITTGKPQTSASADVEAQLEPVFRAAGVRSVLSVPLRLDGDVHGVVAVLSPTPDAFSRQHVAILMTMSDLVAGKLRRSELPLDLPQAPVSAQIVEIDVHSLFKSNPESARVSKPASRPLTMPPSAVIEHKVPPATPAPAAKSLSELLKEPTDKPVPMDPAVLSPSEDPHRYGSVLSPRTPLTAVPVMRTSMPTADASLAMFSAYRAAAKSRRKKFLSLSGIAAMVLLCSAGASMYIWREAPAPRAASSVTTALPATVAAPSSATSTAAPPSKSAAEPSAPAAVAPQTPSPERAAREIAKPKPEVAKAAPVEPVQQPAAIVHLPAREASPKPEDAIAPPVLGLAANTSMPNLPAIAASGASLAVHKSVLVPPVLLQGRPPAYPTEARMRGVSGVVQLQVSISAEGKITDVRVVSGDMFLRQAAVAAVREWKFRPGQLDGKPVASTTEVSVRFK